MYTNRGLNILKFINHKEGKLFIDESSIPDPVEKLSNIIEPTLYKTKLNEIKKLQDKQLSLIFFQRVENHLLRERFRSDKINTDDFIKWALDYKYLRKIDNESP